MRLYNEYFKFFKDFFVRGKSTANLLVIVDFIVVNDNFKYAAMSLHKFSIKAESIFYGCRQTGGNGQVISLGAVSDLNSNILH